MPDLPFGDPLLFGDLAEFGVVQHDVGDVHVVLGQRGELHGVLAEPAIAANADDLTTVADRGPCSHGCW